MIEKIVLDYLRETLGIPAYMEMPEIPPKTYVVVEKVGSGRENKVTRSTLAIQSYAPTLAQAAELNKLVKQAMDELTILPTVGSSRLNSDYNYTDTNNKKYRYQAVYDLTHY
jgi:hypothetical protein